MSHHLSTSTGLCSATAFNRRALLSGATLTAAGLTGAMLTGCQDKGSSGGKTKGAHLTFIAPGDVPPQWDRVLAAVNAKLGTDLGMSLEVQWIGWSNYLQAELLKYTSGEKFTASIEADWAHLPKLAGDGALFDLDDVWAKAESTHPNLYKTINPRTIETSRKNGKLWGIPQVNNATSLIGFMIRQDLADGEVTDFAGFERFLYGVKEKKTSVIPYGMDNGYINSALTMFDDTFWSPNPEYMTVPVSNIPILWTKIADAKAGTASLVPIWEVPAQVEAIKRVRRYYLDGILNKDLLNVDKKTIWSLFTQGKYGAAVGVTDGQMTATYGSTTKNVKGAKLELVVPYSDPRAKLFSSFGTSNYVVFNKKGDQMTPGMQFMEWLSIKENHDLLEYGVEGTDWTAEDDMTYTPKGDYFFPGYTMCWRVPLERSQSNSLPSEAKWLDFVRNFDNFELSPLAGFALNENPIKTQLAQFSGITAQVMRPLQAGKVDSGPGIDALKKAFDGAGIDKVAAEAEKQLGAYFQSR